MDIKPIETEYKGYRFRSRLEARWAVFFDAIGIKWEYEPEGYQFEDGTMYLPDFKLLNVKNRSCRAIFVEVKGNMKDEDMHKINLFSKEYPILVIKSIEDAEEQLQFWEGDFSWSFNFIDGDSYPCMFTKHRDEIWLAGPDHDEWDMGELMKKGIKAAKQARFEHGENPFMEKQIISGKERKIIQAEKLIILYLMLVPQEWEDVEKIAPLNIFTTPINKKIYETLLTQIKRCGHILNVGCSLSYEECKRLREIECLRSIIPITFEGVKDCADVLCKLREIPE